MVDAVSYVPRNGWLGKIDWHGDARRVLEGVSPYWQRTRRATEASIIGAVTVTVLRSSFLHRSYAEALLLALVRALPHVFNKVSVGKVFSREGSVRTPRSLLVM